MKRNRVSAFTLIELFTSIAVITLLVFLLLPTLQRAICIANQTKCAGNQDALYKGWYAYALANRDMICDAGTDSRIIQGQPAIGVNLSWAWVGAWNDPTRGVIYPYVQNVKPYACPTPAFRYGITYAASSKMNGQDGQANDFYFKMDTPSKCFLFLEEADYRGYNMGSWMGPRNPSNPANFQWVDYVAGNHSVGSIFADNIMFADGHGELFHWTDFRTMGWRWGRQWQYQDNSPDIVKIGNVWRFLSTDPTYKSN